MDKHTAAHMGDTSKAMQDYYNELVMSKTPEERFRMGLEMTESGRELMLAGIRHEKPGLSESAYRNELLKRMMRHDESLWWLEKFIVKDENHKTQNKHKR